MEAGEGLNSEKNGNPTPWKDFERRLIEGSKQRGGIFEQNLPIAFRMDDSSLQILENILERRNLIQDKIRLIRAIKRHIVNGKDYAELLDKEIALRITIDDESRRLTIEPEDVGMGVKVESSLQVEIEKTPDLFGFVHTHPFGTMPTATDLVSILAQGINMEIIVTPRKTYVLVRTNRARSFKTTSSARYYLNEVAIRRGKRTVAFDKSSEFSAELSQDWIIDLGSLQEIGIACYEGKRGKDVFVKRA